MPFPVSISFSSNSLPLRTSSAMPQSSSNPQQNPRRNPAISSGLKRARPRGLWKARGSGPRLSTAAAAPPPTTPSEVFQRRIISEFDSDDDQASCSSSVLLNKYYRRHSGSDTPLSTDIDDSPHPRPLVTKHQQYPQDYFSIFPQLEDDSSDDDSTNWTRTRIMDITTTAGSGDTSSSLSTFTYEDWLDLKQLFNKACEQYEIDDAAETLPLLRGVIHECHRCLLVFDDPSLLFVPPPTPDTQEQSVQGTPMPTPAGPSGSKTPGPSTTPLELPTAFHTLLGTTLFYFGNSIGAHPGLALPGEPANPVPYWIAALDVFETGESIPNRNAGNDPPQTYQFDTTPSEYVRPLPEDWRMAIMWGRTLVSIATEMVDRSRGKPPPPPEPQYFPSPFPVNMDYLKTGTIWDEEPEWPSGSPFGVIVTRRPAITRRMTLNNATPHEMLQLAMDHFSRGIFHLPHNSSSTSSQPFPMPPLPQFTRSKTLYEVADEVLLFADKLDDPAQRKEWAAYADSVFSQIHVSSTHKYQSRSSTSRSSSKEPGTRPPINEGVVAKGRGQAWLAIGSTIAEAIEERMDRSSDSGRTVLALMQSEEAEEARNALTRAVEFFKRAKAYISGETAIEEEEEDNDNDMEIGDDEGDDDEDVMIVDDIDNDDDADDEQDTHLSMSARIRGKQRQDSRAKDAQRPSRFAKRVSKAETRKRHQQAVDAERKELSRLLAEAFCSLANLTESQERQEEYYRQAEVETGPGLFVDSGDDGMDEDS